MTNKEAKEKAIEQMRNDGVVMSMQDIDRNNGWTRIEPDGRNLPKINSSVIYYKVCYQESEGFYKTIDDRHQYNAFQLEEMFRNGDKFSHFKLIEKEKYPIW